jgi:hypothetical protein
LGWPYYPYPSGWDDYPDYGYDDNSQPYATQTWYYCSDPAGYYPYVTQCNTAWQPVPAKLMLRERAHTRRPSWEPGEGLSSSCRLRDEQVFRHPGYLGV